MKRRTLFGLVGAACLLPLTKAASALRPRPKATIEVDGDITRFVMFIGKNQDIDVHWYRFYYDPDDGRMWFEIRQNPSTQRQPEPDRTYMTISPNPDPVWEL